MCRRGPPRQPGGMTTHRAPKPAARTRRPVERAVVFALLVAVPAGAAWLGGMIYTIAVFALGR
ncbi:hypothetical protein DN402_00990 [Streptomyces sp. SW4]|nr:hypothetical protein DN402_00990 [Streptomyces sp. SW4]